MAKHKSSNNPFCKKQRGTPVSEIFQYGFFSFATYCILLCALVIFGKIIIEGAPVIWRKGADFITQKPQTLAVVEAVEAEGIEIPTENFDNILSSNDDDALPLKNVEEFKKSFAYKRFLLMPRSIIKLRIMKHLLRSCNPQRR